MTPAQTPKGDPAQSLHNPYGLSAGSLGSPTLRNPCLCHVLPRSSRDLQKFAGVHIWVIKLEKTALGVVGSKDLSFLAGSIHGELVL